MKTSNVPLRFAYCMVGILLALLLAPLVLKADCPSDNDTRFSLPTGGTATSWAAQPSSILYNIPGTDCWIDIFVCSRDIFVHTVDDLTIFYGKQFFITEIDIDPSSGSACDNIDFSDIITNHAVEGVFQSIDAQCSCPSTCSRTYNVYRQECWQSQLQEVGHPIKLTPCGTTLCSKQCYVCFNLQDSKNHELGCIYSQVGSGSVCATPPPHTSGTWALQTCYRVPCSN